MWKRIFKWTTICFLFWGGIGNLTLLSHFNTPTLILVMVVSLMSVVFGVFLGFGFLRTYDPEI
jgi:hypothetical protein